MASPQRVRGMSTRTPRASRTSAEPQRELAARLPCLATYAPAAGSDDGGGGGDVESVAAIAAGAAGVDQMWGTEACVGENGRGVATHDGGETGELLRMDGAGIQSEKQS